MKAFADGASFDLMVDDLGEIKTDCHVCAANFDALWDKVRKSKNLIIIFSDGRSSTFDVRGAQKVLDKKKLQNGIRKLII